MIQLETPELLGQGADDVRVSGVGDTEARDAEVLSTRGSELNVVAGVMVDAGLGKHRVVFNLRLAQRGAVVRDYHKLGCCHNKCQKTVVEN